MSTGWACHELYFWHDTGHYASVFPAGLTVEPGVHAENSQTKRRFRNLVEVSGLLDHLVPIRPRPATEDELARFHSREHIARVKAGSARLKGDDEGLTPYGHGSFEIACLAAGGTIAAVEAVLRGEVGNAYALARPPGHHAVADSGMGFCLFGNVAVAVMHARAVHGLGRVATVDWDVHHGNGTQAAFYGERDVLTISIHQDLLFPPDSGRLTENGSGAGEGANLNIPLPAGSGVGAYVAAFERVVVPALRRFRPELIVVPSGFDASGADPLGRMMMTSDGYRQLTRLLMDAADELCGGRLVMSHEGGYSEMHAPYCGLAIMETLTGRRTGVVDPWQEPMTAWAGHELLPHQDAVIQAAAALVDRIP
jgi:acetoin utilization deacetylase AcuC-like enzyme